MKVRCCAFGPVLLAAFLISAASAAPAGAAALGDVNLDGEVGAADVLLLRRHLSGDLALTTAQQLAADVAPPGGAPLGPEGPELGADDLLRLLRAVKGEIVLPEVEVPSLDAVPGTVSTNGVRITGSGVADGTDVHFFLDGVLAGSATASGGEFSADLALDGDGSHEVVAVAETGGPHGGPSALLTFQSADAGPFYGDAASPPVPEIPAGQTAVWFPREGGEAWEIRGSLTVAPGASLTIHAAAVVEFGAGARLVASGAGSELVVAGAPGAGRVQLVADGGVTTRGFWEGIQIDSGAQAQIDQARIAYAANGIHAVDTGTVLALTHSEIFGIDPWDGGAEEGYGAYVEDGALGLVQSSLIHSGAWDAGTETCVPGSPGLREGVGVFVRKADLGTQILQNDLVCLESGALLKNIEKLEPDLRVEVADNRLMQNLDGIWLGNRGDAALVGNDIVDNTQYGIHLQNLSANQRYPVPSIAGNNLFGNTMYNLFSARADNGANDFSVPGRTPIVAENNYWGVEDSDLIAASIRDMHDYGGQRAAIDPWTGSDRILPLIDWVPFHDAGGNPMIGTHLVGDIPTAPLALQPDTTYKAFLSTRVAPGTEAVVPRGVTVLVTDRILVEGDLTVNGETSLDPAQGGVLFTSAIPNPDSEEYWEGINADKGVGGSQQQSQIDINFATIEYAQNGLNAHADTVSFRDSRIRFVRSPVEVDTAGLAIRSGTINEISRSEIEGDCADPHGTGINAYRAVLFDAAVDGARLVADNRIACFERGIGLKPNASGAFPRQASLNLQGNLIELNRVGVHITEPQLGFSGNTVTVNLERGVHLEVHPGVSMAGNEIFANGDGNGDGDPDNLRLWEFAGAPREIFDFTDTYWGVDTAAEIQETIDLSTSSDEAVDVEYSNFLLEPLDTAGGPTASGTLNHTFFLFNQQRADAAAVFSPREGGTGDVTFQLYEAAHVELLICTDVENPCGAQSHIRVVEGNFSANPVGPPHTISWDGKDDSGSWVPESAYSFALRATGTHIPGYQIIEDTPTGVSTRHNCTHCGGNEAQTLEADLNPYANQFLKIEMVLGEGNPGEMLQWAFLETSNTGDGDEDFEELGIRWYLPRGTHEIVWDGRAPDGSFVDGPLWWRVVGWERLGGRDWFIVEDTGIEVFAPDPAMPELKIEVQSTPFLVYHSYEQISEIAYRLSRDALVRVTLLPPGVYDPMAPEAIVLQPETLELATDGMGAPKDHYIEWRGYNPSDTNQILEAGEGAFTFVIEAADPASPGTRTVHRGALQLRN